MAQQLSRSMRTRSKKDAKPVKGVYCWLVNIYSHFIVSLLELLGSRYFSRCFAQMEAELREHTSKEKRSKVNHIYMQARKSARWPVSWVTWAHNNFELLWPYKVSTLWETPFPRGLLRDSSSLHLLRPPSTPPCVCVCVYVNSVCSASVRACADFPPTCGAIRCTSVVALPTVDSECLLQLHLLHFLAQFFLYFIFVILPWTRTISKLFFDSGLVRDHLLILLFFVLLKILFSFFFLISWSRSNRLHPRFDRSNPFCFPCRLVFS